MEQQVIHDAAANLFWTYSDKVGLASASEEVIASAGQCLLNQPFTTQVLSQYGYSDFPDQDKRKFGQSIAAEADAFAVKGENLSGVIYAEDAVTGRSPTALGLDTSMLNAVPKQVRAGGPEVEKLGVLCLRHPLPAVVFSKTKPRQSVFEVADTALALGFSMPMYLGNAQTMQVADSLFVTTGILYIPVPDKQHGVLWGTVIQNSCRFVKGASLHWDCGQTSLDVQW